MIVPEYLPARFYGRMTLACYQLLLCSVDDVTSIIKQKVTTIQFGY